MRAIPLSGSGTKYVAPVADNAYNNSYPLARFLWLSVNYKPGSQLDPLRREFIKLVFSQQETVIKDGYFPIGAAIAKRELAKVGISTNGNP